MAAAENVFGRLGYHAANISDITKQARVSTGTFYNYFQSKEDIFRELVRNVGREMRHVSKQAEAAWEDRFDQEREGFKAFFKYLEKHRYLYRILRQAEFVDEQLYREHYETYAQGYIAGLKRAMAQGQIRSLDAEVLAWCLMGVGEYLGLRWVLWGEGAVPDRVIETMMQLITDGLRQRRSEEGQQSPDDRA